MPLLIKKVVKKNNMKQQILMLIIFLLGTLACQSNNTEKDVVEFFEIIAKSDSSDVHSLMNFMQVRDSLLDENGRNMIKFYAYGLNDHLKSRCEMDFEIIHHNQISEHLIVNYRLQYEDLDNVYYVVCNDKIFTSIIFENGKVISFFPYLIKNSSKKVIPVLLN